MKDEKKRLNTVRRYLGLKISREKELQDIVKLAAEICKTPIALITLMEEAVQYIRFSEGTDVTQNSRENSFCRYLVGEKDLMEVPDALNDSRFNDNPFVVNSPNIRFYAGAPLNTYDNQHLGTLCVFDVQPKRLTDKQKEMLTILSRQVINIMELEMNTELFKANIEKMEVQDRKMALTEFKLQSFFESSAICHVLAGKNGEILFFNKMAFKTVESLRGKNLAEGEKITGFISGSMADEFEINFEKALSGETLKKEYLVNYENAGAIWWDVEFTPATSIDGKITGVSINAVDITAIKMHEEKIMVQNAALRKIAQMQSHEFRPTVANIMGLINIIKADEHCAQNQYFFLLEQKVSELDKKIRAVVDYAIVIPGL